MKESTKYFLRNYEYVSRVGSTTQEAVSFFSLEFVYLKFFIDLPGQKYDIFISDDFLKLENCR